MPVFTPKPWPPTTELKLLASAALPLSSGVDKAMPPPASLAQPGPFNTAAALSTEVTRRILDLEFVEMSEESADAAGTRPLPGSPPDY